MNHISIIPALVVGEKENLMSFKDLSSKTPLPANDKAKAVPATAKPGKTPAEGAPTPKKS